MMPPSMKEMLEKATEAMERAYAPYSHFAVGACLRAEDGQLFIGCNVENASYGLTFCAEANAIGSLVVAGRKHIIEALIVTKSESLCPPCGSCRQRLFEFASSDTKIHLCNALGDCKTFTMQELLPFPFSSKHLGIL
jgi:cytidine deaminase